MLIQLLLISFAGAKMTTIDSEGEFLQVVQSRRVVLALVYSSKDCLICKRSGVPALGIASNHVVANRLGAELLEADLVKIPSLRARYGIKGAYELLLFVRNQVVRLPEFRLSDSAENNSIFMLQTFVHRMKGVQGRLLSFGSLKEVLTQHPTVFLFLGNEPSLAILFRQLAQANLGLPFFQVVPEEVQSEIYEQLKGDLLPTRNLLCVARAEGVGKLDVDFACQSFQGLETAQRFVDLEKFPKLRTREQNDEILKLVHWRKQAVMFLSSTGDAKKEAEFFQAVKSLPKNMIFAITQVQQAEPTFRQIFLMAKVVQTPDVVYIAYSIPGEGLKIEHLTKEVRKSNIEQFAFDFQKNHPWLFEVADEPFESKGSKDIPLPEMFGGESLITAFDDPEASLEELLGEL